MISESDSVAINTFVSIMLSHNSVQKSMLRKNGKAIARGLVEQFKYTYQREIASRTFCLEHFENS